MYFNPPAKKNSGVEIHAFRETKIEAFQKYQCCCVLHKWINAAFDEFSTSEVRTKLASPFQRKNIPKQFEQYQSFILKM